MHFRFVACLLLLAAAPMAVAVAGEEDEVTRFTMRCRDGQPTTADANCDIDAKADGTCSFGLSGTRPMRVPAGETRERPGPCGTVGVFTCVSATAPLPPKVLTPPGAAPTTQPHLSLRKDDGMRSYDFSKPADAARYRRDILGER